MHEDRKLDEGTRSFLVETARALSGYDKRQFLARSVEEFFGGVPYRAEQELGWNRGTMTKALLEARSGVECFDGRAGASGRKPVEAHLPNLFADIKDLLDGQSQTDARFRTDRLYTRMTIAELHKRLGEEKGYAEQELPSEETLRCKVNQLGYRSVRVQKTQVKKRSRKPTRSSTSSRASVRQLPRRRTNS